MAFAYPGWDLHGALDALHAYDSGATDSGVKDEWLKAAVKNYLDGLSEEEFRLEVSRFVREHYLTEKALKAKYGLEDVLEFARWLDDELGIHV